MFNVCNLMLQSNIFRGLKVTKSEKNCKILDNLSSGNIIIEMEQMENVLDKVFLKIT